MRQTGAEARDDTTASEALARIAGDDATLQAWVYLDRAAADAPGSGPLAGIPFGVKDVIDVAAMPTRFGLDPDAPPAQVDAWAVAAVRAAGAIPVGKTHSTALAFRDPAPTRNPHHPDRTPGGSSAGSAAAVAAGHVPFAFGTQTVGSTLRPAAFCGAVGFKPTYGAIPTQGVAPQAPSLDTVGVIAADAAILRRVAAVLLAPAGLAPHAVTPTAPLRIGYAPDLFADRLGEETRAVLAHAASVAARTMQVDPIALPAAVSEAIDPHWTICRYEARIALAPFRAWDLPPFVAAFLRDGDDVPRAAYEEALRFRNRTRATVGAALEPFDAVLIGGADPPASRENTGDTTPWMPPTFYGLPAIALPAGRSREGLPIAVQLVGARGHDAALIEAAYQLALLLEAS